MQTSYAEREEHQPANFSHNDEFKADHRTSSAREPEAEPSKKKRNENPQDIGLLALLYEDYTTYDRNPLDDGLWAIVMHRLGNALQDVQPSPLRGPMSLAYSAAYKLVKTKTGIELPHSVKIGRRVRISPPKSDHPFTP
ncbi:MAG: hypothetical protein AAFN74_02065 [Myxococcota bacterium]